MHIKIGNIQIFSYIDDFTHDEIFLLHVGENCIKKYTIEYEEYKENDASYRQKKRDAIIGDCIKTLFETENVDPNWKNPNWGF